MDDPTRMHNSNISATQTGAKFFLALTKLRLATDAAPRGCDAGGLVYVHEDPRVVHQPPQAFQVLRVCISVIDQAVVRPQVREWVPPAAVVGGVHHRCELRDAPQLRAL